MFETMGVLATLVNRRIGQRKNLFFAALVDQNFLCDIIQYVIGDFTLVIE